MPNKPITLPQMSRRGVLTGLAVAVGAPLVASAFPGLARAAEGDKLTWAVHFSPTSLFFDPGVTPGTGAPLIVQYAVHDALIRPIEGEATGLSLAESMEAAEDGLSYTFKLREGLKFQNGDPLTAEDAKFSFDRYKGANQELIREFVTEAVVLDPLTIQYKLSKPWPDFLTLFGTPASGVAWVLPKAYMERVGEEGFKNAPIGAGPYKLTEYSAGNQIVFEASEHFWRTTPEVPTLVLRMIPDDSTRLAAIQNGEVDFAYAIQGDLILQVQANPDLRVIASAIPVTNFILHASMYDESSPWSNPLVRRAANMAIDREGINAAAYASLGYVSSSIIPHVMDFYWDAPKYEYDPEGAMALLEEAGYGGGFDGGDLNSASDNELAEFVQANLAAIGINMTLRTAERAAYLQTIMEKNLTGLVLTGSGAPGNAATRLQQFVASDGALSYVKDDELDEAIAAQASNLDVEARTAQLHAIQKKIYDEAMVMPIMEYPYPVVIGPRVDFDGVNAIPGNPYTGPYEKLSLKP